MTAHRVIRFTPLAAGLIHLARRFAHALAVTLCVAFVFAAAGAATPVQAQEPGTPAAPASRDTGAACATTLEVVDNPYGFKDLWGKGDLVARSTLIILVLMSAGSWYLLVTKLYEGAKLAREARSARSAFFKSGSLHEGARKLKAGGAFRHIADTGISATQEHEGELTRHIDRNTWVTLSVQRALDDIQARQQDGLAFLGTVGSTAPFIGLFGTVWGILHALTAIGIAGQASIDKVAGPVGEALMMTAVGLAVAVPAVLGYNWIVRRNKVLLDVARSFGAELHGVLLGAKVPLANAPTVASAPAAQAAGAGLATSAA